MRRYSRLPYLAALLIVLANAPYAAAQDPQQYLRDHYQGKTLVLRGFYSASQLHYDSSGAPEKSDTGDWTEDGFVLLEDIHVSRDRLNIKADRLVATFSQKQFQLRPSEVQHLGKEKKPVLLKIEAEFPQHNPSPEQVDALMSRIFLSANDRIADAVPAYWKPCVARGVAGKDSDCVFSQEILAVPGVAGTGQLEAGESADGQGAPPSQRGVFRVGGGVLPPRVIAQENPEFNDSARAAKYQGVVILKLVVNKEGVPTNIRIARPLGFGLDAKAVEAVENWKFSPATRGDEPVAAEIAVEVNFHLY